MPTRKQRRRREKEKRHEYEVVYLDDSGREVEVEHDDTTSAKTSPKARPQAAGRGGRQVQPPSWRRTLKRSAIFAPILLATVLLLNGSRQSLAASLANTVLLVAIFVPFSHLVDTLMWRSYQKRLARSRGQTTGKR